MIENLLRCNICKQSVNENELEKHIFSTEHQEKKISLMNNAKLKENEANDLFVRSVIDQWKE